MSRMSNTKYPRNDGGLFLDATTRIFRSTHRICLHAYYAQLWASIKEVPEVPLLLSKLSSVKRRKKKRYTGFTDL
jgi:hypothetical protein